jgi:transmembrane sensor
MISDSNINLIINILGGTATSEEKQRFEDWLRESEDNRLYYKNIRTLWESSTNYYGNMDFDKEAAREKIRSKIQQIRPVSRILRRRFAIPAAASIILLIGMAAAAIFFSLSGGNKYIRYTTANQIREIILSDSSHIWLNVNSTLHAPETFSSSQRIVKLEGEAYFEVKHNESKPFKVKAGNTIIKVLGTSFDVKTEKESDNVSVVVNSGKVAFYKANSLHDNYILTQGTKGQFIASNQNILISGNEDQNYLSWKTGMLNFYDSPLKEVCKVLSEYYNTSVTTDLSDSNLFLTGSFQNENLEDILNTIELTLDLNATVTQDGIVIHNQINK